MTDEVIAPRPSSLAWPTMVRLPMKVGAADSLLVPPGGIEPPRAV